MRTKEYIKIWEELGCPKIYLVPIEQFRIVEGYNNFSEMREDDILYGISSDLEPIISLKTDMRGKMRTNTIYHEFSHHLWPWRPHWWHECFGEKMARGGGRGDFSRKYGHTVDDLPDRAILVKMAQRASKKFNERWSLSGKIKNV